MSAADYLNALYAELSRVDHVCPVCGGLIETTPSGAVTCTEHGSDHYRWVYEVPS